MSTNSKCFLTIVILLPLLSVIALVLTLLISVQYSNEVKQLQIVKIASGAPSVLKAEYADGRGSKAIPSMYSANKTDFIPPPEAFDMSKVVTFASRTYIPINVEGKSVEHVGLIMGALNAFEKARPDLQIVPGSQTINEYDPDSNFSKIYGIWLDVWPKGVPLGPDD